MELRRPCGVVVKLVLHIIVFILTAMLCNYLIFECIVLFDIIAYILAPIYVRVSCTNAKLSYSNILSIYAGASSLFRRC